MDLCSQLHAQQKNGASPRLTAYNRIDGPGSSLDLREFQQCFWKYKPLPDNPNDDPSCVWSNNLPRTVGITINLGCVAEAHPLEDGKIGVVSHDYSTEEIGIAGEIPYKSEYWLLKTIEQFGLKGLKIEIRNILQDVQSSGLGGSATASTAVCLLANKLAGEPFKPEQIVAMASMIEQDMGVSITGTQEQSNVVYGGVTDYIWFPWGIPGKSSSFGSSMRFTLLDEDDYPELEKRMALIHSGKTRASTDVNQVWREKLTERSGMLLHRQKLGLAYEYREGLRLMDWGKVSGSIKEYRNIRISLCKDYMDAGCWDIQKQCEKQGAESFPLGAGGGGVVLVFSKDPSGLSELLQILQKTYRNIDFSIRSKGHEFENII